MTSSVRVDISRILVATFFLLTVFTFTTSAQQSVECDKPPGPPGKIVCEKQQIASCDATGERVEGECYTPNKRGKALQALILSKILGEDISVENLQNDFYQSILRNRRLKRNGRTITFSIPEELLKEEIPAGATAGPLNDPNPVITKPSDQLRGFTCQACFKNFNTTTCESAEGISQEEATAAATRSLLNRICGSNPTCLSRISVDKMTINCARK